MGSINSLIRDNIRVMKPYSSARDEYEGNDAVFLDANENPYFSPLNRYPDPRQRKLKSMLSAIKSVPEKQIFLGNGSDEVIDLLIRAFCEPVRDNIVSVDPTYGMYEVAASVNAVEFRKVPLDENFDIDAEAVRQTVDQFTKMIFLCSPNNPTANSLSSDAVLGIAGWFGGLLVIDEAYIDFSSKPGFLDRIGRYPNMVIIQTLSKAWGRAGIRLGMAFGPEELVDVLNRIKPPYNISSLNIAEAVGTLGNVREKEERIIRILEDRNWLEERLAGFRFVKRVFPSDSNFILVRVDNALNLYNHLLEQKIIVRDRSGATGCSNCLRITVGTKEENMLLFEALKSYAGNR